MKKFLAAILILVVVLAGLALAAYLYLCANAPTEDDLWDAKVTVDGVEYGVVFGDGAPVELDGADALREKNRYPEFTNDIVAKTHAEAAEIGIAILNRALHTWTEAGVSVGVNQNLNAWVVAGQLLSRESGFGDIGVIVIGAETGEILYIGWWYPNT